MADDDHKPKLNRGMFGGMLVPKDRVVSRGQGCWNCKWWSPEKAKPLWTEKRQNDLATAAKLALESPKGENDVRVYNIRAMVNSLDHLVATGHAGICLGNGRTADGNPVGDLVVHSFLCDRWSGVTGSSLATGGKTDMLPEELADKLNKPN